MKCPKCRFLNPDDSKFCRQCGHAVYNKIIFRTQTKKELFKNKTFISCLLCLLIMIIGGAISGNNSKETTNTTVIANTEISEKIEPIVTEETTVVEEQIENIIESTEVADADDSNLSVSTIPEMTEEEFRASCVELNYKDLMRYPDEYIGKNFKVKVQIFKCVNGKFWQGVNKYYKTHTEGEYGYYSGNMIWILDERNEEDENYLRLLEDDVVEFYGTFNGLTESKNSFTGEKTDDVALYIYYADLISE